MDDKALQMELEFAYRTIGRQAIQIAELRATIRQLTSGDTITEEYWNGLSPANASA
jgi:hypothetical protein